LAGFVFPEMVTIRLVTPHGEGTEPLRLAGIAFRVKTFHCRKNDYNLGPFFSDGDGVVAITSRALALSASSTHATGIMDYGLTVECGADVELVHWSPSDIMRAEEARRLTWTHALPGEEELYGSLEELLRRFREAPNDRVDRATPIRDRWDGSRSLVEYQYLVSLSAAT
jgi:hypothetical protein